MITALPIYTTHTIEIIHRYEPTALVTLALYNEATELETIPANTHTITNGIMAITFDFTFEENDKYQVKVSDLDGILYRGKLIATSQDPQVFEQSKDLYYE